MRWAERQDYCPSVTIKSWRQGTRTPKRFQWWRGTGNLSGEHCQEVLSHALSSRWWHTAEERDSWSTLDPAVFCNQLSNPCSLREVSFSHLEMVQREPYTVLVNFIANIMITPQVFQETILWNSKSVQSKLSVQSCKRYSMLRAKYKTWSFFAAPDTIRHPDLGHK